MDRIRNEETNRGLKVAQEQLKKTVWKKKRKKKQYMKQKSKERKKRCCGHKKKVRENLLSLFGFGVREIIKLLLEMVVDLSIVLGVQCWFNYRHSKYFRHFSDC